MTGKHLGIPEKCPRRAENTHRIMKINTLACRHPRLQGGISAAC
jgi:hypothetical protein